MSLMGSRKYLVIVMQKLFSAVIAAVKNSNMSTLNCIEEVHLAEKLLDMHKWADKVKFARTGGEANALSVKLQEHPQADKILHSAVITVGVLMTNNLKKKIV